MEENVTSPSNVTSQNQQFLTTLVSHAIVLYIFPVVVIVGTVGNLTSIAVLLRQRMRSKSVYLFLLLLAVADTVVLYVSAFKTWIRVLTGFELVNVSIWSCRIVIFLLIVFQHMAGWIVVLVTIDRFIAVWFPLKATSWCTVPRACLASVICAILVSIYSGHVFWTFELSAKSQRCRPTMIDGEMIEFMKGPFNHLKFVTYCLLPFVVILLLNVLIVVRLRWTPTTLRPGFAVSNTAVSTAGLQDTASSVAMTTEAVSNADGGATRVAHYTAASAAAARQKQQSRVTYMLLSVSIAWLLLTAPFALFTLLFWDMSDDPETYATQILIKTVCFLLMYINHAVNFFLYCLTGRKFRQELKDLVSSTCRRPSRRWSAASPSMRTTRSNCVELEPLNNESQRTPATAQHASGRRPFFVGEPANEVVVAKTRRDVTDNDVIDYNDIAHLKEDDV